VGQGTLLRCQRRVNANADLDSLTPRFAVQAREAIQAHLATLFVYEDTEHEQQEVAADRAETTCGGATARQVTACSVPSPLPVTRSPAEQGELAQENATRHDWIAEQGKPQREVHGLYRRTADFRISTTDPDATPMRLKGGGTHLGYQTHYVVDGGKQRIILGVLVTPGEVMENQPMLDLLWRVRFRWKLQPRQVTGDTTYGTIENIKAIEDAGIHAYVPLPDWEHMTPYFGPSKFTYNAAQDVYLCPQGQSLRPFRREYQAEKVEYRADAATCNACSLKAQCTSSEYGRQVHRSFHASYLERVKGYHQTPAYQKAMNKRKVWVEPLFAEAKDWHGMRRFRLRLHGPRQLRSLAHRGWTKSETLAQKARLGTAAFPSGSRFCPLFGSIRMDNP